MMERYVRAYYVSGSDKWYLTNDPDNDASLDVKTARVFSEWYFDKHLEELGYIKEPLPEDEQMRKAGAVGLPLVFE